MGQVLNFAFSFLQIVFHCRSTDASYFRQAVYYNARISGDCLENFCLIPAQIFSPLSPHFHPAFHPTLLRPSRPAYFLLSPLIVATSCRPFSVSRYFCSRLMGLSGIVYSIRFSSISLFMSLFKYPVLDLSPSSDNSSLADASERDRIKKYSF